MPDTKRNKRKPRPPFAPHIETRLGQLRQTLQSVRSLKGITQEGLAQRFGVSPRSVQRWESPEHFKSTTVGQFLAMADACGLHLEAFGVADKLRGGATVCTPWEPPSQILTHKFLTLLKDRLAKRGVTLDFTLTETDTP